MGSWPRTDPTNSWPADDSWPENMSWPEGGAWPGDPGEWTPARITSVTRYAWFRADLGVQHTAGSVDTWSDQWGLNHATQGGGASRPLYTASDADFDNQSSMTFDGLAWFFQVLTLDLPIPAVGTPVYYWVVLRQVGWTSGRIIMRGVTAAATACMMLQQNSISPEILMFNGVNANTNSAAALGSTVRLGALFTNSIADALLIAGTSVTGANASNRNHNPGTFSIGASGTGTSPWSGKIAEILITGGEPTEPEFATYGPTRYPTAGFA